MTPKDLAENCWGAMHNPQAFAPHHVPMVGIVSPTGKGPLQKKLFPKWLMLTFDEQKKSVYWYPAKELFNSLVRNGLVNPGEFA